MPSTIVETVRGPVVADQLGPTLPHEHIFIASPEGIINHNHTWGEPWWDEEVRIADAVAKLTELTQAGYRTLIDPTAFGLSRNIPRIQRVNAQVEINIAVCTGIYAFLEAPAYFKYRSAESLADIFTHEIETGIDDTGVKAAFLKCAIEHWGVIGDLPVILDAIALAQTATGVPVMVHTSGPAQTGRHALAELTRRGVDPTRIVIAHAGDSNDLDYHRELADSGAMLGFDRFNTGFNSDENRIESILTLVAEGYGDRIHLSHDASAFNDFSQHNPRSSGRVLSYTHIHRTVLPVLRQRGLTEAQLDQLLVDNPRRFLAG